MPLPEDISLEALVRRPGFEKEILGMTEAFMHVLDSDANPVKGKIPNPIQKDAVVFPS